MSLTPVPILLPPPPHRPGPDDVVSDVYNTTVGVRGNGSDTLFMALGMAQVYNHVSSDDTQVLVEIVEHRGSPDADQIRFTGKRDDVRGLVSYLIGHSVIRTQPED